MENQHKMMAILETLYQDKAVEAYTKIEQCLESYRRLKPKNQGLSEKDVMVITYADSITSAENVGLRNLQSIFSKYIGDSVSAIHLLPFFDYSSDDGFSVIDYKRIHHAAGQWEDVEALSKDYDLMFDAVINHISCRSDWFKKYLDWDEKYKDYFITCDPDLDYSSVTRPRALPLLSKVVTKDGEKYVWTTFSEDQIDLNFKNIDTMVDIIEILLFYVSKGARYIRLDAVGFLWKEIGSTCMNLHETHEAIRLMRLVIEEVDKGVRLITETNIPHEENISYFGENFDEAHLVYQFPLPPLVVFSFLSGDASKLMMWYKALKQPQKGATFFNFIASHDGIGLRPCEGILTDDEVGLMEKATLERGGRISYRNLPDGGKKAYEMNISLLSLLCGDMNNMEDKVGKFLAAQSILLAVIGVPGIYIHSLLGSENDIVGMEASGINRRINREKLDINKLSEELDKADGLRHKVLMGYKKLLNVRKQHDAFSPQSQQSVELCDRRIFAINRISESETIKVRVNVSKDSVIISDSGTDVITGNTIEAGYMMKPYEYLYIK